MKDFACFAAVMLLTGMVTALGAVPAQIRLRMKRARMVEAAIQNLTEQREQQQEIKVADETDYVNLVLPEHLRGHAKWIMEARRKAVELCRRNGEVSSDDIWQVLPPPEKADPRVMGAVFFPRDQWIVIRSEKSARKINHGRRISVWQLVEQQRAAA